MLGYRSYPKEVQELVKKDEKLRKLVPKEINLVKVFIANVVLFVVLFFIVVIIIKYTIGFCGYVDIFAYLLILGETLNLFDLLVIDLLWW